jgi:hypothetical protein
MTPMQGAATGVYLAVSKNVSDFSGKKNSLWNHVLCSWIGMPPRIGMFFYCSELERFGD